MQRHSLVSINSWMPSAEARRQKSLTFWLIRLNGTTANMSLWGIQVPRTQSDSAWSRRV